MKKQQSLLDTVKSQKTSKMYSKTATVDEVEVAIAWAKGEVTLSQIMKAMKVSNINVIYTKLAHCFRAYVINNNVKSK